MKTNDNQYYIYLRATKQRIPCTKEQFDDYYRDINAYRRTQQNHGRCVCLPSKRLSCDMDCYSCPYHTPGDMSSLDSGLKDDDGEEMNWLDHLQETMPDLQTPSPADYVSDALMSKCAEVWVFGDRISAGMEAEIRRAKWKSYRLRYFTENCEEVRHGI